MRGGLLVRGVGRRAAALSRVLWRAVIRRRGLHAGRAKAAAVTASQDEFDNRYVTPPLWTGQPVR